MKIIFCLFLAHSGRSAFAFVNNAQRQVVTSSSRLFEGLEPLAEEGTWQAFLDEETTGLIYYFDSQTGESLWEPPTSTFPQVRLPRKKQREADDTRRLYRKTRQQQASAVEPIEQPKKELPNWIEGVNFEPVVQEKEVAAPEGRKGKDWFGSIFGDTKTEAGEESAELLRNGETVVKRGEERRKRGILESLTGMKQPEPVDAVETPVTTKTISTKKKVEKKIVDLSPKTIKIEMGSFVLPHPAKVRWGGEDAVFTKGRTFGCFDGVSGADKLDGVPLYSVTLANEMNTMIGSDGVSLQQLTAFMTEAAQYADSAATGASTAVVASIGENGFLQALNIGDSVCMVIRDGRITSKTREISHYWECPYQLSEDSPDRPKDGTKLNVELIPGDLVVMGSDGIFDNIDEDMLLDAIEKGSTGKPAQLARKICDLSRKQSLDRQSVTPYGLQAKRRGDQDYSDGLGGKLDDASCIVVRCK